MFGEKSPSLTFWFVPPAAEVSNLIGNRVKKPRLEGRSYVVPDSILVGARDSNTLESSLAEEEMVHRLVLLARMLFERY